MNRLSVQLENFQSQIDAYNDLIVLRNQALSGYTSYGIGGPANLLLSTGNDDTLKKVLKNIQDFGIPLFILGHGSNVLVADGGWPGVVLYFGPRLGQWWFDGETAIVKSGTPLNEFIKDAVSKGLSGLEQLAGIPGSVGGALRMNAGAFGQEIQNAVVSVFGYRLDGTPITLNRNEIFFDYRLAPQLENVVITGAKLQFNQDDKKTLKRRMDEIINLRIQKQPLEYPSCGSVFKRPKGYYAGALIEEAGLKGLRVGDAMVSPKHSGFIVNLGNATARDIYRLIQEVEERVRNRFNVQLEREVKLIGDFNDN